MNVLIIEDEQLAARRLQNMVLAYDPTIKVLAKLESVEDSVEWFKTNPHPDLIFLDIHLEDDLSFAIFEKVKVDAPIIFTTAFDEYAIRAFKLKSIDYLLKPIIQEELNNAIAKYKAWNGQKNGIDMSALFDLINKKEPSYRERFSVSYGQKIKSFNVSEIAYFYSREGMTYAALNDQKHYPVDYSLDTLLNELNPTDFFRINRQYLIKHASIKQVHVFPKSHLKLELSPKPLDDTFVSIDKVTAFKKWLGE
ncbi:MAG TPA: DNA-binding response regulator [Prolixibacteraceae bacterium]|jgi:DNA-binding LytR/AlgR family response regulator|nr:DNA-binding response regulator [Prolixibacteraceae bacterium]